MKFTTALFLCLVLLACNQEVDKEETTGEPQPPEDTIVAKNNLVVFNPDSKLYIWSVK